ncbi:MAG: hypothetical protein AAB955_00465 [Patescibacteria group bacterium]
MAIITETEVRPAYDIAPQHVKDFIDSNELFDIFYSIKMTYNLHVDQAGNLAMLIDAILLEMHPLGKFQELLKDALGQGIDQKTYEGVLRDVNEKVFTLFRGKTKARADAAVQPAPPKPTPVAAAPITLKPISVMEQKMSETVAPVVIVQKIAAPPAEGAVPVATPPPAAPTPPPPSAPARYHGADPYREMPE